MALAAVSVCIALGALSARPVHATAITKAYSVCDRAAAKASETYGVPLIVLRAITRTETGRSKGGQLHPWPWTVNMEGKGEWFQNQHDAQHYVARHFDRGARSFDVGCFQINYRWHGQAFSSIEEMFDPTANANYAAQFLKKLHGELGSWEHAVGSYHSRTPKYANRYLSRFRKIAAGLEDVTPRSDAPVSIRAEVARDVSPVQRETPRPARLGSLVPLGSGRAAILPRIGG